LTDRQPRSRQHHETPAMPERQQHHPSASTLASALFACLAFLILLCAAFQPWVDPRWLFMDPQTVGELRQAECCHVYDGAMSNLGLMVWAATAAVAWFAIMAHLARNQSFGFAAHSCAVSGTLLLDDTFLLHEVVLPKLGVSQTLVVAALGGMALIYLVAWRDRLMRSRYAPLLYVSLLFFTASLGIDQVFSSISSMMIVIEDGSKFIGIVFWFLFHVKLFRDEILLDAKG